MPKPGHVVEVTADASVQFAGNRGFRFRVQRVQDRPTYSGWCWIDGYQLDAFGDAVEKRSIFVQISGLRPVPDKPRNQRPTDGRPNNAHNGGHHD